MKQRSLLLKLHNLSSIDTSEKEQQTFDMVYSDPTVNEKCLSPPRNTNTSSAREKNIETPLLFPTSVEYEVGGSDEIGYDWAMQDDDYLGPASTDLHPIQTVTPPHADEASSLYSFFFEDASMCMGEEDTSVSLHDDISLDDADFCLDSIRENPEAFWSGMPEMTQERRTSPAQISLSSEIFDEIQKVDCL